MSLTFASTLFNNHSLLEVGIPEADTVEGDSQAVVEGILAEDSLAEGILVEDNLEAGRLLEQEDIPEAGRQLVEGEDSSLVVGDILEQQRPEEDSHNLVVAVVEEDIRNQVVAAQGIDQGTVVLEQERQRELVDHLQECK